MRFALLLPLAAVLAGCGGAGSIREQEAARANEVAPLKGGTRMFGAVPETIAGANQFGFRAADYKATGGIPAYRITGNPITITRTLADKPNQVAFEATGNSADAFDTIRFTLNLTDDGEARQARERFRDTLRAFLLPHKLDDKGALEAIVKEETADFSMDGIPAQVVVTPAADTAPKRITVTFTRPGANSAGNS